VDPSLTVKDGKQDAEEDDDEKHELHVQETGSVRIGGVGSLYQRLHSQAKRYLRVCQG
jgi:hypothetical protein